MEQKYPTPRFNSSTRHAGHSTSNGIRVFNTQSIVPDLGLSTRSLVRRARSSGSTIESLIASDPRMIHSGIYRDSQVREFAEPVPLAPTPAPVAPTSFPDPAPPVADPA